MRPAGPKTGGQRPHVLEIDPARSNGPLKTPRHAAVRLFALRTQPAYNSAVRGTANTTSL